MITAASLAIPATEPIRPVLVSATARLEVSRVTVDTTTPSAQFVTAGQPMRIFGGVLREPRNNAVKRVTVALQQRTQGGWRTVTKTRAKLRQGWGEFDVSHVVPQQGSHSFRVRVLPAANVPSAVGRTVKMTVLAEQPGRWTELSAGYQVTCGIKADGSAWCWGWNSYGVVGNGTTSKRESKPVRVAGGGTWSTITTSNQGACGIKTDGTAWCWADAVARWADRRLRVPVQVDDSPDWVTITTDGNTSCGTKTDGSAWCWGWNLNGERGNGTTSRSRPSTVTQVDGGDWQRLDAGGDRVCGLKTDQSAWCWGRNDEGTLGIGDPHGVNYPTPQKLAGRWTELSIASDGASCGVATDGTVRCWGIGTAPGGRQELGPSPARDREAPADVFSVSARHGLGCGIRHSDQRAWCWGYNEQGAAGTGDSVLDNAHSAPVFSLGRWTQITTGEGHTCGIKTDGTAWCWGDNYHGEVGVGWPRDAWLLLPVQVTG